MPDVAQHQRALQHVFDQPAHSRRLLRRTLVCPRLRELFTQPHVTHAAQELQVRCRIL